MLSVFREIESRLPTLFYAQLWVGFSRANAMSEDDLREIVAAHHFSIAQLSYRLVSEGNIFEYRMYVRSARAKNARALAEALQRRPEVLEFRLSPTGD